MNNYLLPVAEDYKPETREVIVPFRFIDESKENVKI